MRGAAHCDDVIDGQIMGHDQIADYKTGQSRTARAGSAPTRAPRSSGEPTDNPVYAGLSRVL